MITIKITGDQELITKLSSMPNRVHAELLKAVTALSFDLVTLVKRKLTNDILHVRTGKLRDSIFQRVTDTETSVVGQVASQGSVKYAAIHEFGGTINIPASAPVNAKAMHFFAKGGAEVFARHTRAHTVIMPERSFMRSSLKDMKEQIKKEINDAVVRGMK